MGGFTLRVGSKTAQGFRADNEDALAVDMRQRLFLVADGMGGQDRGEIASGMAVDLLPRLVYLHLQNQPPEAALRSAMLETNESIMRAGQLQPEGKRMGTTAVVALLHDNRFYVTHLGDSRAYLIRNREIRQLTTDHSVAQALVESHALTPEEAVSSPYQHVLHRFLGCSSLGDKVDVSRFDPEANDWLLLATDGLTNHVAQKDLADGPRSYFHPQLWADHLVQIALQRGSRDNVTCIVVEISR